jgi:hypothetical protein
MSSASRSLAARHPGELGHVRAGQHRQPDRVGVLLQRGGHDLLRGLVQPGEMTSTPASRSARSHHLGAPVVPVRPGLAMITRMLTAASC